MSVGVGIGVGFGLAHLDRELRHVFQEHGLEPDAKHQAPVGQPVVQGGAPAPRQKAQQLHVGERDLVGVGVGVGVGVARIRGGVGATARVRVRVGLGLG